MKPFITRARVLSVLNLLIICVLVFQSCRQDYQMHQQILQKGWNLESTAKTPRIEVAVPGLVQTDLFNAGIIPDPFYGINESELQWIGKQSWTYKLSFFPDQQLFENDHIQLIFEGLDTHAKVWLNGEMILSADNMFRSYVIDVTPLLTKDSNELKVTFYPVDSINALQSHALPYSLPDKRAFSRKAPYQLGWDWGPVYATMGVWKPVKLVSWSKAKINYPGIQTIAIEKEKALLELLAEVESDATQSVEIHLFENNQLIEKKPFKLNEGLNQVHLLFEKKDPILWWPNGAGEPHLYQFRIELYKSGQLLDVKSLNGGIRKIELIQEPDERGASFKFNVNGQDVFIKGANYIPEDHFPVRVQRNQTRQLLLDAANVHMNMLRVWGGGVYPSNDFYELCDSLGIMVWQDFMFACTMYPFDSAFMENVRNEAYDQVKRLRQYPSLAMWCGNNEISEGFYNWGWQKDLSWTDDQNHEIWQGYQKLFEKMLPEVIETFDPQRPYWPSSPSTGWGRPESLDLGDVHYWGVWWGAEPFEIYQTKVGRFHSEYGFQAIPSLASLKEFVDQEQLFTASEMLEAHQKHPRGTELIFEYMQRDFPVPSNLEDYAFVSQLVQKHGITMAIEAHRRNKPVTMGTLYWQLNDSWPAVSWSSIDFFGRWKALHYALKDAYAPLLLSVEEKNGKLEVIGVKDTGEELGLRLEIDLKDFNGNILRAYTQPVQLAAGHASILSSLDKEELLEALQKDKVVLHCKLFEGDNEKTSCLYFFVKPKQLKLRNISPQILVAQHRNYLEISIQGNELIKDLMLSSNDTDGRFENNFFNILPGKVFTTRFYPSGKLKMDSITIDYKHFNAMLLPNPY